MSKINSPYSLWVIAIMMNFLTLSSVQASGSAAALTVLNNAIKLTHRIAVEKNLSYGDKPWQQLNVYPQPGDAAAPVVLFIYGGGWHQGKKEHYHFVADALVRRGYVVVIPDYIKYPDGRFPTFVEDIALATAWVKNNINKLGGNPQQVLLAGHSAGAHTGALLVTDPAYLQAVGLNKADVMGFVGLAGPYNFTPKAKTYVKTFGPENFEVMKANTHVDGSEPPIKLLHSTGDKTVGLFNLQTFRNRLMADGVAVETVVFDDIGHAAMVLKMHPWFADEINLAEETDVFFQALIDRQFNPPRSTASEP